MRERRRVVLAITLVGAATMLTGVAVDPRTALAAYLATWLVFASISIGALGMLHMTYLIRRAWTEELHAALMSAAGLLPIVGVLFVPVLLGAALIYPAAKDPSALPAFKAAYLAPWFSTLRTAIYFAIWTFLAVRTKSAWGDQRRMNRVAAAGLIVLSLTISLAGVDWLESLNPEFHSSIYGLLFLNNTLLAGLAFSIAVGLLSRNQIRMSRGYGGLLLGALLLWAYLHAMQYIVIWSANIPAEGSWYLVRTSGAWGYMIVLLALAQFLIPFFLLLIASYRRNRKVLLAICTTTLLMRWIEMLVLALPDIPQLRPAILAFSLAGTSIVLSAILGWLYERRLRNDAIALRPAPAET